jgi:hypothetical protein
MTQTRNAMSALAAEPNETNVDQARAAFATLEDVVDTHFSHEERDLGPMMADVVASPRWKDAQSQIRKTQSPSTAGLYFAWLLDGADPEARAFLRHEVPPPVLFVLSASSVVRTSGWPPPGSRESISRSLVSTTPTAAAE